MLIREIRSKFDALWNLPLAESLDLKNCAKDVEQIVKTEETDLHSLLFPLPHVPLKREFARRVTVVEALKTAQRASLAELDVLFATLQHRAFRGEL